MLAIAKNPVVKSVSDIILMICLALLAVVGVYFLWTKMAPLSAAGEEDRKTTKQAFTIIGIVAGVFLVVSTAVVGINYLSEDVSAITKVHATEEELFLPIFCQKSFGAIKCEVVKNYCKKWDDVNKVFEDFKEKPNLRFEACQKNGSIIEWVTTKKSKAKGGSCSDDLQQQLKTIRKDMGL